LFPTPPKTLQEHRRRTAQVSRKLQLLRAHGLIARIRNSYRYKITPKGEALMNAAIFVRYKAFPKELKAVA
jgi:predicted transcriptional regulator